MSDIDWYDRCQTAEAELLLVRADNERLRADRDALFAAADALLCDVKRRHPGEPLRCPYMQALEAAVNAP